MLTKKINNLFLVSSQLLNVLMLLYIANVCARMIWWIASPSVPDLYVYKNSVSEYEQSTKYISNRIPFGEIIVNTEKVKSAITDHIKLTGVYTTNKEQSIAFIVVDGVSQIVAIGDTVFEGWRLKAVNISSIVVSNGISSESIMINYNNSNGYVNDNNNQNSSTNQNNDINPDDFMKQRQKILNEYMEKRDSQSRSNSTY